MKTGQWHLAFLEWPGRLITISVPRLSAARLEVSMMIDEFVFFPTEEIRQHERHRSITLLFHSRCNFAVRNLADNIHTYTVQCSLPINLFNEKIFLIVWFWLYFTTICTLFGFLYWMSSFLYPRFYKSKLMRYLSSMKRINIHHFPQNPFQEQHQQTPHRAYPLHHSSYNRRHSFVHSHYGTGGSHYGSLHAGHPHHALLSSFANRTMKSNFDAARLSRVREQLSISISAATEANENNTGSSGDQTPPSPATPQPIQVRTDGSFSISTDDDRLLNTFLANYLGRDGIVVLYILQMNTNEVITGEIVTALFELFKTSNRADPSEWTNMTFWRIRVSVCIFFNC